MTLRIVRLTKRFGAVAALDGLDLDVERGELVGVLGPSGSGKSTLLRVVAGLDDADSGLLEIDGRDSRALEPRDRRVGLVFQSYALFRHMTVAENIAFGLSVRPRRERPSPAVARRRVGELLELMQLEGYEARFPSQLSGGQRQRVALARALAVEPALLLLDEPFGALDAKVRGELRSWLRDLQRRLGFTALLVTHDQDEALELSDRVAILNRGQVEQVGTPGAVYERPATPFVTEFLGAANRFEAEIRSGAALLAEGLRLPVPPRRLAGVAQGPVLVFVRPHEVRIGDADGTVSAEIRSIATVGPRSTVQLSYGSAILKAELPAGATRRFDVVAGGKVPIGFNEVILFPQAA